MPQRKKIQRKHPKVPKPQTHGPQFSVTQSLVTLINVIQTPTRLSGHALKTIGQHLNRSIEINPYLIFKNTSQNIQKRTQTVLTRVGLNNKLDLTKLIQNVNLIENKLRSNTKPKNKPRKPVSKNK